MLAKMIQYATEKHGDQVRKKNGRPYVHDHCLKLLQRICCDPRLADYEDAHLIIVGHDIFEDCTENDTDTERYALFEEVDGMFGARVAIGIGELSNEYTKARHPTMNRAQRKEKELVRLKAISPLCQTLKLYDRELNLEDSIAEEDFNPTYAMESWDIGHALGCVDNIQIATRVMQKAALIMQRARK